MPVLRKCPLSELISPVIQTQMYATGTGVWYQSRSKGGLLLATVIGLSPSGPEFLHIRSQGTGDKVVDHTAAKISWLEVVRHSSPRLLNCPLSMTGSSRLFGVVKRIFTQCLWKGHLHRNNIMSQCDSHYRCCACTATVLKCYSLAVQSRPPTGGNRHLVTPRGGGS